MITLIFLVLAGVCAGIYFWTRNRAEPTNHYHRNRTSTSSRSDISRARDSEVDAEVEVEADRHDLDFESNEALGIRIIEKKSAPVVSTPVQQAKADCVVVLNLMAPEGSTYSGYELLQALLAAGLRFGKNRIFHRHTHKDGRGDILFHCASAIAPGTFDLTQMGAFSCPGLSLFFSASNVAEPLTTFDCLLETIDLLVEDLGGRVLDEKRELFTKDRMIKYRQQLRAFENNKNTADLFAE